VPFAFGPLNKTPQLALLVGNLVGFAFGQRRGIRLDYLGKTQLGPTTWELAFQPARPVRFVAGQYMELTIPHRMADFRGSRRYFSISSAPATGTPADDGPITFAITVPEKSSSFKQALLDLEPGAVVRGTGVSGDFALPADTTEPLLLVAGGIGITPFASQLAAATARGEKRDVTVVYANSVSGALPYADLLEKSGAHVVLYSPEAPSPLPKGWDYAGPGRVTGERLAQAVPDVSKRRAFVSGPPSLVADLRRALHSQGARRVHSDYFSGY
jgi:ferredoxin-NADP reductase